MAPQGSPDRSVRVGTGPRSSRKEHSRTMNDGEGRAIGCLGSLVGLALLVAVVLAVAFVGLLVLAIVAAVVVAGFVVLAVDRLLLALSPRRRERRIVMHRTLFSGFSGPGAGEPVIEATAQVEERSGRDAESSTDEAE